MGLALQRKPPKRGEKPVEHRRPLGRLRLFLDDLDDVHKLLLERTKSVSITADNAVADTPDDLRDATRRELDRVRFVTSDPDVVVVLAVGSASARTSDESPEALAIIDDVQALLEPRRQNLYHFFRAALIVVSGLTGLLVILALIAVLLGTLFGPGTVETLRRIGESAPAVLILYGGFVGILVPMFRHEKDMTRIIPERRGQARRFTAQTRTAWLVGMVGVVLTAVITAIVTYAVTQ